MNNWDDIMSHPIFARPDVGGNDTLEAVISWIYADVEEYIESTSLERWQWRSTTPPNILAYAYFREGRHLEAQFRLRAAFPHLTVDQVEGALIIGVLCWCLKRVEDSTRVDDLAERLTRACVRQIPHDIPIDIARWCLIKALGDDLELTMACCEAHLCV